MMFSILSGFSLARHAWVFGPGKKSYLVFKRDSTHLHGESHTQMTVTDIFDSGWICRRVCGLVVGEFPKPPMILALCYIAIAIRIVGIWVTAQQLSTSLWESCRLFRKMDQFTEHRCSHATQSGAGSKSCFQFLHFSLDNSERDQIPKHNIRGDTLCLSLRVR